jgi:hypothetical protein
MTSGSAVMDGARRSVEGGRGDGLFDTATCVDAAAVTDAAGIPAGTSSFPCIVDADTASTIILRTTGTATDPAHLAKAGVVSLMTLLSTFAPTG